MILEPARGGRPERVEREPRVRIEGGLPARLGTAWPAVRDARTAAE